MAKSGGLGSVSPSVHVLRASGAEFQFVAALSSPSPKSFLRCAPFSRYTTNPRSTSLGHDGAALWIWVCGANVRTRGCSVLPNLTCYAEIDTTHLKESDNSEVRWSRSCAPDSNLRKTNPPSEG